MVACSGEVIRLLANTLCKFSVCFPKEKRLVEILLSFSAELFGQLQQNWRKEQRLQNTGFLQVSQKQIARQKAEIPAEETAVGAQVVLENKAQRYSCLSSWISCLCNGRGAHLGCGEMQHQVPELERDLKLKVFSVEWYSDNKAISFSSLLVHPTGVNGEALPGGRCELRKESSVFCPFWFSAACWHYPHPFSDIMRAATQESIRLLGRRELLSWEGCFVDVVYFNTPRLFAGSWAVKCQVRCFGAVKYHGKRTVRRQLTFHCIFENSSEKAGDWRPSVDSLKISLLLDC